MCLWGRKERKVVSTVRNCYIEDGHSAPQPSHREVRAHQQRARKHGHEVKYVLNGVDIKGTDGNWSSPLVMDLVKVLVQQRMVEQPTW